ncbi:hypothetical protein SETIT_9G231600v2 [Setaria italica]|uniref:F-box domain-containing protein n=1 Tax=Setaria italica TaxID=4555 RepID=K4AFL3_SETIT|nr:hypothetical protein SETIT_9G231600v2 [Setaria italica]RCV42640.1 hypothetical protein SETIT_9G231600v2 [Setaria italica]
MAERKRKRAAEEWERRKRDHRRRRREGQGKGEELLGKRQVGWAGDPVEALGEVVMGRVMELLDARSVARCTVVSRAWRGVAADDRLWAPKCAELMAGKAHIPRLTLIRTGSKLSTYSMAIMDGKRSRITKEDLCDHAWEYCFTIALLLTPGPLSSLSACPGGAVANSPPQFHSRSRVLLLLLHRCP